MKEDIIRALENAGYYYIGSEGGSFIIHIERDASLSFFEDDLDDVYDIASMYGAVRVGYPEENVADSYGVYREQIAEIEVL
jgi:hypothetical protein|tara:strand:+ start:178 stop:420 length:243 start_codon:yes stop_codon:yes gene_type:complete